MDQPSEVMDSTVNIQQLCRLCGSKTEEINRLNIFDSAVMSLNLQFKIKTLLGIEINIEDSLPKVVCVPCLNNIDNFSAFKATCEMTACLLYSLLKQQAQPPLNTNLTSVVEINSPPTSNVTAMNFNVNPETILNKYSSMDQNNQTQPKKSVRKIKKKVTHCKSVETPTVIKKKRKSRKSAIPYKCDWCSKNFNWRECIIGHIKSKHLPHSGKFYTCKICDKKLKTKGSLRIHKIRIHKKNFTYVCDLCGKGFVNKQIFETHVRSKHTNERPFECEQCDRKFACKYVLNTHITNVHKDESVQWICNFCNKSYASKSTLTEHKKKHLVSIEDRKKVQCNICSSKFENDSSLRKHMRIHTGEKPYECKLCSNSYARISSLKIHMLTHTGERNHICEVCGSAFALVKNLDIHKLSVHEGKKMFKCNDCDKSYTQNKNLNIHLKSTGHTKFKK